MKKTKAPSAKKKGTDRVEDLVKGHLAQIAVAENMFKGVLALLEKHKTKYPELEQYVENLSPSERSISLPDNVKEPRRTHRIFRIAIAGTAVEYQIKQAEEKDPANVNQAAWTSNFEEALAKVIAQIILARQSEPESK